MHDRILLHVAWTTRNREPLITRERGEGLVELLPIIARQERCRILQMGMVTTHLHLVLRVHPTTQLPRLLQRMKGGTAYHLNRIPEGHALPLRWAKGYSVTSVSPGDLARALTYVREQARRHPREAIAGFDPSRR